MAKQTPEAQYIKLSRHMNSDLVLILENENPFIISSFSAFLLFSHVETHGEPKKAESEEKEKRDQSWAAIGTFILSSVMIQLK